MTAIKTVLGWILFILFVFIALLVFGMGGILQGFLLLGIASLFLSPIRSALRKLSGVKYQWWAFLLFGIVLWGGVLLSFILNPATSIYKSEEHRARLMKIYEEKLAQWPVPYKTSYVDTKYGKIHVIISGPEEGYPVLLINASGLSGWSWIHNVEALNAKYRTYAIDNIGEGGKNEMLAPGDIPHNGQEIAEFYSGICDQLGIEKANVIGASIGGYIATNFALYAPNRVHKLVLLGSMGYGTTTKTIVTMMLAQGIPLEFIQNATFRWAFSDEPHVVESFGKWFRAYMQGVLPTPIVPWTLKAEDLKNLQVPTLIYFGTKDSVVGNAYAAEALAENIPHAEVKIVDSGHMIGAELADLVNPAIMEFFEMSPNE